MTTASLDTILIAAGEAGAMTAKGSDGMMHLGKIVYQGALAKLVTDGKAGNVKEVYKAYLTAATASEYGSKVKLDDDKVLKFGVSKLATFVKFAKLPGKADAKWELVRQTVRVVNEDANKGDNRERRVVSRYEQALKVLRGANKAGKAKFSDTAIRDMLAPKEREGDAILRELEAFVAKAEKAEAMCQGADLVKGGFFAAIQAEARAQLADYKARFVVEDEVDLDLDLDVEDEADEPVKLQPVELRPAA